MSPSFKLQCHFILICLVALRGESRYLEVSDPRTDPSHLPVLRVSSLGGGQTAWVLAFVGVSSSLSFALVFPLLSSKTSLPPCLSLLSSSRWGYPDLTEMSPSL